jgi:hypothetical protein
VSVWIWGDIPSWLTAVVSIAGFIFAVLQLRELAKQAKLQTYSDYTRRYEAIVARLPEDVNSREFRLVGRTDYAPTMRAMRSYFDLSFEEWDLNEKNLIDRRFWDTWSEGMSVAMSKAAFQQAWEIARKDSSYGQEFEEYLDRLVASDDDRVR